MNMEQERQCSSCKKSYAITTWFCQAEGRQVKLCQECRQDWQVKVGAAPELAPRCPMCSGRYLADRGEREARAAAVASSDRPEPLSGPVADAISDAMFKAGVLVDVRTSVLYLLAADPRMREADLAPAN